MSEYDSDIEFDFFDEPETGEGPPTRDRPRQQQRPPGGPPRRPERAGIPPTARLVGLIAFGILIIVLLVLWVQSCSGTSKKSSYRNYLAKVNQLAIDSSRFGTSFKQSIAAPAIKASELANKFDTLAQQQQTDLQQARVIKAPAALSQANASVVQSLQFRVGGLRALADGLRAGAGSTKVSATATVLATQAQRLVASDVIWQDRFVAPTRATLTQQDVTGLAVPGSHFLTDLGVDSQDFWTPLIQRLNGNGTSGNTGKSVGSAIVDVLAKPDNKHLSTSLTKVTETPSLEFDVTIQNSGEVQLPSLKVTLTIKQQGSNPITAHGSTGLLNPSKTTVVVFKNLPQPAFVTQSTLTVDVQTVPGETNPNNNTATYPVIFSLG